MEVIQYDRAWNKTEAMLNFPLSQQDGLLQSEKALQQRDHHLTEDEYAMCKAVTVSYISDVPYRDSIFISKLNFKSNISSDLKMPVTV